MQKVENPLLESDDFRSDVLYSLLNRQSNYHTKALQAFPKVRWICGGLQKEGGLEELHPHLDHVIRAYVIGREAEAFARQLPGVDAVISTTMEAAVAQAAAEAVAEEVVLLAPAAASFDQYDSFAKRGEDFAEHVKRISKS